MSDSDAEPEKVRSRGARAGQVPDTDSLDAEDQKLVTLAKAALARSSAGEAAAVRDEIGRTYVASAVDLPSLRLTALQLAVAQAVSSGATTLEAAAVVLSSEHADVDDAVVRDLSTDAPVHIVRP